MAIQKEFVIRHHLDGHVRFQVPRRAVASTAAALLETAIADIEGVRAVKLYRSAKKLSIRYDEPRLSFIDLARQLHCLLATLEQQGHFAESSGKPTAVNSAAGLKQRVQHSRVGRWWDRQIVAAKETAQAARILGKLGSKGPKALIQNPEKAVIDFLNDILVLYLIKTHWGRITQQWLPKPFTHRYEWLATFYLFFLLVRSRRPK